MILRSTFLFFSLLTVATAIWANEEAASDNGLSFEDKLASCAACHGENGAKPILPEYPVLAGQHANYLAHALRDYRDGRRKNPIMAAQVQALGLSPDDIEQLAAFFGKQTSALNILKN